ncbi:hypothetical protein GCM10028798_08920 [Humibacter antri]
MILAAGALVWTFVINAGDPEIIGNDEGVAIILGAVFVALFGGIFWWFTGVSLTLTSDEAILTRGYVLRKRIERSALVDFFPYLHRYATRGGVQYRLMPTFTITDGGDGFHDVPLQFLSWNPARLQGDQLTPRAAYVQAWAQAGTSSYAYAVRSGGVPDAIATHRQRTGTGLRRRSLRVAILTLALAIAIPLTVGFAYRPVANAFGWKHPGGSAAPIDPQSDRSGIRDLNDSLTPTMPNYRWAEQPVGAGKADVRLLPNLTAMPAAAYTVRYLVRDPAERTGASLSTEERKYGKIITRGTLTGPGQWIDFALDHGDTKFTLELYVTNVDGHTSRDANLFQNLG